MRRKGTPRPADLSSARAGTLHTWRNAIRTRSSASGAAPPRPRSRPPGAGSPAQHHPDLTGDDPAASRVATRQMAEINDAYAALTREPPDGAADRAGDGRRDLRRHAPAARRPAAPEADAAGDRTGRHERRPTGRATRPPRHGARRGRRCPASRRRARESVRREPPRASTADRAADRTGVRALPPPAAAAARGGARHAVEFGKFHGHTLGQIAAFEPSYIDWLARDGHPRPGARRGGRAVVQADLDRRGILRAAARPERASVPAARPDLGAARPAPDARTPPDTGGRSIR